MFCRLFYVSLMMQWMVRRRSRLLSEPLVALPAPFVFAPGKPDFPPITTMRLILDFLRSSQRGHGSYFGSSCWTLSGSRMSPQPGSSLLAKWSSRNSAEISKWSMTCRVCCQGCPGILQHDTQPGPHWWCYLHPSGPSLSHRRPPQGQSDEPSLDSIEYRELKKALSHSIDIISI